MGETINTGDQTPESSRDTHSLADAVAVGAFRAGGNVDQVVGTEFASGATFEAGEDDIADTIIIDPSKMPISVEMMKELGLTPPSAEPIDDDYHPPVAS